MNKVSIYFLKLLTICIGILVLYLLIRFPLLEGRALHLSLLEIYSDTFIIYIYVSSIAFFTGLYQCLKLLKQIGHENLFTVNSIHILGKIKYCSYVLVLLIALAAFYIRFFHNPDDDPAGFLALSMLMILFFASIGTVTFYFQKSILKALVIENTL